MGTHPIFESDFDCLTDGLMSLAGPNGGVGEKKKTFSAPTVRLQVELEKTSKDSFPEFSFLSLKKELSENIGNAEKENHDVNSKDANDLAAYFERKYGNFGNTAKFDKKKRRRHERLEDFMDMGEGYDCEDDFIDDTGGKEIFAPQDYDTWHNGFYVNQGNLRFKMSDEEDSEEEKPKDIKKPVVQTAAQKIIAKAKKAKAQKPSGDKKKVDKDETQKNSVPKKIKSP